MTSVYIAYKFGDELQGYDQAAKILGVFNKKENAFKVFIPEILTEIVNAFRIRDFDYLDDYERTVSIDTLNETVKHMHSCLNNGTWTICPTCAIFNSNAELKTSFQIMKE